MTMTLADFGIIAGIICIPLGALWASINARMKRFEDRLDASTTAFVPEGTCEARMSGAHVSTRDIGHRVGKLEAKVFDGA